MAIKDKLTAGLRNLQNNLRLAYAATLNAIGGLTESGKKGSATGGGAPEKETTSPAATTETKTSAQKDQGSKQQEQSQEKAKEKKGLFGRLLDMLKKFFGLTTTTAGSGMAVDNASPKSTTPKSDPVSDALKKEIPEQTQKQAAKKDAAITVDMKEGKPLSVGIKSFDHPDAGKPGHVFSSTNADHFTFREASNVEGVQGKIVNPPNKAKIVESIAEIETRAYKKTADDMGLQYKHQRGADGSIHHEILNKDNKPLTAEQWSQFQTKNIDNFNEVSKQVCKDQPFTIMRIPPAQTSQQTYQSTQQAAQQPTTANQQQQQQQQQSTPSETPTMKGP